MRFLGGYRVAYQAKAVAGQLAHVPLGGIDHERLRDHVQPAQLGQLLRVGLVVLVGGLGDYLEMVRVRQQGVDTCSLQRVVQDDPVVPGGFAGGRGRQVSLLADHSDESVYSSDVVVKRGTFQYSLGLSLDRCNTFPLVNVYSNVIHFLTSFAVKWIRPAENSHSPSKRYFTIRIP